MATALQSDTQRTGDRHGNANTARTGQTKRVPLVGLVAPLSTTAYPSSFSSRRMAVVTTAPQSFQAMRPCLKWTRRLGTPWVFGK